MFDFLYGIGGVIGDMWDGLSSWFSETWDSMSGWLDDLDIMGDDGLIGQFVNPVKDFLGFGTDDVGGPMQEMTDGLTGGGAGDQQSTTKYATTVTKYGGPDPVVETGSFGENIFKANDILAKGVGDSGVMGADALKAATEAGDATALATQASTDATATLSGGTGFMDAGKAGLGANVTLKPLATELDNVATGARKLTDSTSGLPMGKGLFDSATALMNTDLGKWMVKLGVGMFAQKYQQEAAENAYSYAERQRRIERAEERKDWLMQEQRNSQMLGFQYGRMNDETRATQYNRTAGWSGQYVEPRTDAPMPTTDTGGLT